MPFPGRTYADIVTKIDEAPVGRLMFGPGQAGAATADPSAKSRTPFELDPPADPAEVSRMLAEINAAQAKLDDTKRQARSGEDPAIKVNQRKLDGLVSRYKQFWDDKSLAIREEIGIELSRPRDEVEVLKARRDGKAAAVRKAEAQRDLAKAVVARNARLIAKSRDMVSQEEATKADAELAVAEAEVASKLAEQAEADALLNQTRRRSGGVAHASDPTTPSADRTRSLADFRDGIEMMEVQLQAKQAELRGSKPRPTSPVASWLTPRNWRIEKGSRKTRWPCTTTRPRSSGPKSRRRRPRCSNPKPGSSKPNAGSPPPRHGSNARSSGPRRISPTSSDFPGRVKSRSTDSTPRGRSSKS